MMQAWKVIQDEPAYTQWRHPRELPENGDGPGRDTMYSSAAYSGIPETVVSFVQSAGGDYGALQLARGDFVAALDAFYKGTLWRDAAYVAENVLTVDELKRYVDRQPPEPQRPLPNRDANREDGLPRSLRYLLGRRLMREQRYAEALPYLPAPYDKVAREFVGAMRDGGNLKLPKAARARAWFHAGWIARYAGMELMGTEGAPDGFASRGEFAPETVREERMTGSYQRISYEHGFTEIATSIVDRPTTAELARLRQTEARPNLRFHYRIVGARLMMKAAPLLPDNTPELANVIERAGLIASRHDELLADRWYQQLERRCAQTEVGKKAMVRHWYVEDTGAWSNEERAALGKMLDAPPRPAR
jgi:hypothetical protein